MAAKKPARSRFIFKQDGRVLIRSTNEHIGNLVSRTQATSDTSWDQWWEPQRVDGTVCPRPQFAMKEYAAEHLRQEVHGLPTPEQSAAQKAKVVDMVTSRLQPTLAADGDTTTLREAVAGHGMHLLGDFHDQFICTDKELRDIAAFCVSEKYFINGVQIRLERARKAAGTNP